MFADKQRIEELIPHRDPFLLIDQVLEFDKENQTVTTEKTFHKEMDVFKGHYPDNPIVPGVLLSEAIFQSGAVLMALIYQDTGSTTLVPVLTRIGGAKFKRFAGPGDTVTIKVEIVETISSATIFKGKLFIEGKVAVQIEFTCAMVSKP